MITFARLGLIPVVLAFLLTELENGTIYAVIIFVLAAASDGLDGYLARSRGQVTELGKLLDPLADKILISSVLIALVELEKIGAWVVVLIIAREFAVTGLRGIAATQGKVIAAEWSGKLKTTFQILLVIALIPDTTSSNEWIVQPLLWGTVITTAWSGAEYFWKGRDLLRSNAPERVPDE